MNEDLLMELCDAGSPERLAQIIHDHIPLSENSCTNLKAVAKAVGITEIKACDSPAYEGLLIADSDKSKGVILYSQNSNRCRKRFTVAHELGHFLLPFHDGKSQCALSDMKNMKSTSALLKKEAEANRFAIELLAPQKGIKKFLKSKKEPDIQHIIELAESFKISKEAAARRYTECTDYEVALVLGRHNITRYVLRTKEFPFVTLREGKTIPAHITEQIKGAQVGQIIDWYCVDPDYFLSRPDLAKGKELFCQTIVQKNGFHLSLLSLEDE